MYQNALVTTDGSDTARAALPHVAQVVEPSGKVVIVEVIDEGDLFLVAHRPHPGHRYPVRSAAIRRPGRGRRDLLDVHLDRLGFGRCLIREVVVVFIGPLDARRNARDAFAELAQSAAERAAEIRQLARPEDDQRNDQDYRYLGNADLGDHPADRTARGPPACLNRAT